MQLLFLFTVVTVLHSVMGCHSAGTAAMIHSDY